METMRETAPTEAVGCTIDGGQGAKTEIPAYTAPLFSSLLSSRQGIRIGGPQPAAQRAPGLRPRLTLLLHCRGFGYMLLFLWLRRTGL